MEFREIQLLMLAKTVIPETATKARISLDLTLAVSAGLESAPAAVPGFFFRWSSSGVLNPVLPFPMSNSRFVLKQITGCEPRRCV
jgi:hypothetical protein